MEDKIDLDAIINKIVPILMLPDDDKDEEQDKASIRRQVRDMMKEAIHQALVLASEKATTKRVYRKRSLVWYDVVVDKGSILAVNDLIV